MNSLEWLKNQNNSEGKEEISPHLPLSPRESINLLKNNIFYSDEEKNIYSLIKRLHPLGEVGENTRDTLDYKTALSLPVTAQIKVKLLLQLFLRYQGLARYVGTVIYARSRPAKANPVLIVGA